MRLAILISLAVFGWMSPAVWADDAFITVTIGSNNGYIATKEYAEAHQAELMANIPGAVKIDGFWTPPEQDVEVADRVLRDQIDVAVKSPAELFPDLEKNDDSDPSNTLENESKELALVSQNYDRYLRQFVGVIIEGKKLVFCNYSDGTKIDPSTDYIFADKVFVPGGAVHFLQCRFDPKAKTCANVSMIGSWQPKGK